MSSTIDSTSPCHELYPALQNKNHRWFTTWRGLVVFQEKSWWGIRNLVGFVLAVKNVNCHVANIAPKQAKFITLDMRYQALKVEKKFAQHSIFIRLILKIIVFISTGTTLHRQITQLNQVGDCIQKTQKSLIQVAEDLLNDSDGFNSYKISAKEYSLPIRWDISIHHRQPLHGLLHHLQISFKYNINELVDLLRRGRTWEDPDVINMTDSCMKLACLSYKLTIKYEAAWLASTKRVYSKAHAMTEQRVFPWLVALSFDLLYCFVRSRIIFDAEGNWTRTAGKNSEEAKWFYDDQTPQGQWRQQFNEVIELLDSNIGIDAIKQLDQRFISQLDITKPQECIFTRDPVDIVTVLTSPY